MSQSFYESFRDHMALPYTRRTRHSHCDPHFHAGIELVYILEGEMLGTVNGHTFAVRPHQMLVNNCYSVHSYTHRECDSIVTIIPLNTVPSIQKLLTTSRFRTNLVNDDERRTLEFLMYALLDNAENEIMLKGISYALLGYLKEHIQLDPIASSDQANVICRILNYLNDNFSQQLTVEQVALKFGYSRSRFSHLFKSTIGYSLPQYLNLLRCRSIAEALLSTNTPVVELAVNAGFNNAHTFYAAFKSCYNMTPKQYVRMQTEGRSL